MVAAAGWTSCQARAKDTANKQTVLLQHGGIGLSSLEILVISREYTGLLVLLFRLIVEILLLVN